MSYHEFCINSRSFISSRFAWIRCCFIKHAYSITPCGSIETTIEAREKADFCFINLLGFIDQRTFYKATGSRQRSNKVVVSKSKQAYRIKWNKNSLTHFPHCTCSKLRHISFPWSMGKYRNLISFDVDILYQVVFASPSLQISSAILSKKYLYECTIDKNVELSISENIFSAENFLQFSGGIIFIRQSSRISLDFDNHKSSNSPWNREPFSM